MARPLLKTPPGFDALTTDEKIDYVESLWDHIVEGANVPVPAWQLEILKERLDAYRADPLAGRPWSDVRAELERKYSSPP